jgi:ABC-type nitrate/sulfonate/bicarbonate transport system substrate-binding protein
VGGRQTLALGVTIAGLAALVACAAPAPRASGPASPARTMTPPRERVRLIYTAQGATQVPIWLAQEGGHFLANGLDVELTFVAGSATATQAMLAGEAEVVAQSGGATVSAALTGADALIVATTHGTLPFALAGAPPIQTLEALRGGAIGMTRYGTTADFAARVALQQAGLEPGLDVALVPTGGNAETLTALQTGAIQAALVPDVFGFELGRQGYPRLLDLADAGLEYCHSGIAITRGYMAEQPRTVQRVVQAVVQGMGQFVREPATAKRMLARQSQIEDAATLDYAWEAQSAKHLKRVPYTTAAAVRLVLDELAPRHEAARAATPESFYDNRFIRELDESGFIAKLY